LHPFTRLRHLRVRVKLSSTRVLTRGKPTLSLYAGGNVRFGSLLSSATAKGTERHNQCQK